MTGLARIVDSTLLGLVAKCCESRDGSAGFVSSVAISGKRKSVRQLGNMRRSTGNVVDLTVTQRLLSKPETVDLKRTSRQGGIAPSRNHGHSLPTGRSLANPLISPTARDHRSLAPSPRASA